jgi:hypothetical protein
VNCAVDHLIVAAATLEQGVQWCEATLGVSPGAGGRHPLMGTHNRLLKIASEAFADAYLEIIAIDPGAAPPQRARWFGLDDPALQARLAAAPRLIHLVARTSELDAMRGRLAAAQLQPGDALSAGRDTPSGPLRWRILVRPDGTLPCGGALPTLIQWQGRHPAAAMPASGVTLQGLALAGIPEPARQALRLQGVALSAAPGPALRATLATPLGEVTLESS